MKNYSVDKLTSVGQYGVDKLNVALKTPAGQSVTSVLDGCINKADSYVDYMLPGQEKGLLVNIISF